jgi:hypothetical protein
MEANILSSGVDSLVIGFLISKYRDDEAFVKLKEAKDKAGEKQFGGRGAKVTWFGRDFVVSARGRKGYEWVLRNADVEVWIARKAHHGTVYPEVYVTFRAEYLWREGHVGAVSEFEAWLATWAVIKADKVSRCDLCIDVQMDLPEIDLTTEVTTRARNKVDYFEPCEGYVRGRRRTGYTIGSGALRGRIYDKSLEVTTSGKEWFRDIWSANGWDAESMVTRVEFQARRDFLKEMLVDSFLSLCERLADMWRYYTRDWLRIRVKCGDSHRDRWPVAEWWQVVQGGSPVFGKAYGVTRNKQHEFKRGRMMRQVKGMIASILAERSASYEVEYGSSSISAQTRAFREIQQWFSSLEAWKAVEERKPRFMPMTLPKRRHLANGEERPAIMYPQTEQNSPESGGRSHESSHLLPSIHRRTGTGRDQFAEST